MTVILCCDFTGATFDQTEFFGAHILKGIKIDKPKKDNELYYNTQEGSPFENGINYKPCKYNWKTGTEGEKELENLLGEPFNSVNLPF